MWKIPLALTYTYNQGTQLPTQIVIRRNITCCMLWVVGVENNQNRPCTILFTIWPNYSFTTVKDSILRIAHQFLIGRNSPRLYFVLTNMPMIPWLYLALRYTRTTGTRGEFMLSKNLLTTGAVSLCWVHTHALFRQWLKSADDLTTHPWSIGAYRRKILR